jgi:hypothetical protein
MMYQANGLKISETVLRYFKDAGLLTGQNRRNTRKTCFGVTLSYMNLRWTDKETNPGSRSDRTAISLLSHDI